MKKLLRIGAFLLTAMVALLAAGYGGASYYYNSQHGSGCASCHEMAGYVGEVHSSAHRGATCLDCHETSMATKLRHITVHLSHRWPETIRMRDTDVVAMTTACQKCHQEEYASWRAGPHSATYRQIFTNPTQNSKQRLTEDCFRCHGMHFDGSVRDVVQPVNATGPWHVVRAGFADQPTMPCLTCHWVHRQGSLDAKPDKRISVAGVHDQLAFFDRRERMHFAAANLPMPQLFDGAVAVKMSPDQRQAICYQCHATREPETDSMAAVHHWGMQAGSGDDRTPLGVHAGLSCFACHQGHNENARASCRTCHQKTSVCGIDVETMDTTYANPGSTHNIHSVRCEDCHKHGVPKVGRAHSEQSEFSNQ
jgi:hypothetical protein